MKRDAVHSGRGPGSLPLALRCGSPASRSEPPISTQPPRFDARQDTAPGLADVPTRIGKYELIKEVGRGSAGVVYLSHDPYYGRDVAIKVYRLEAIEDAEKRAMARKMFLSEAQLVGRLSHPNLLPVYDAGEEQGRDYVVTEFVHGARTLAAYGKPDNLLTIDDVVVTMYKCAKALAYAHTQGVIHRDLKPSNIMLTVDNDVRIIDFGIALHRDSEASRIEGIAGSPSYMSPEQVQAQPLTHRSDLYSLGAVMYELLTGFRPFRGGNLMKLLHQIVYATPEPIAKLRHGVPAELDALVMTLLAKDPAARYADGQALAATLLRLHEALTQRPASIDAKEQVALLRRLKFFHDFSHDEIAELLRAGHWQPFFSEEEIVKEGDTDDRFYVVVSGRVQVERLGRVVGVLAVGDCFGETGFVRGAKRLATIRATGPVTVLKVSATLLEQVSAACQLRFNRAFLRSLIGRLQGGEAASPAP